MNLPPGPTDAPPGSMAKMKVMRWRYLNGYHIFHPDDNKVPDPAQVNPFFGERAFTGDDLDTGLDDDDEVCDELGV